MPRFEVTIQERVEEIGVFIIDAITEEEAEEQALEQAENATCYEDSEITVIEVKKGAGS